MIEEHWTDLKKYCCYVTGLPENHPDVQDLFSASCLKLLQKEFQYSQCKGSWMSWARRVVKNIWADYCGDPRRKTYPSDNIEQVLDITGMCSVDYLPGVTKETLDRLSLGLNKSHLSVLYLTSIGMSGREMSELLAVPVSTIYSRRHYARQYMKRLFSSPI